MEVYSPHGGGDPVNAKPRILIVDDEADFLFSASVALRQAGFDVVEAAGGREALSRVKEFLRADKRFDLLLTDLRMPFMCGLELLAALEELGVDIPVIAVTGYCDDALRADLMKKGCNEFLEKPFEPHDLVTRVKIMMKGLAYEGEGI